MWAAQPPRARPTTVVGFRAEGTEMSLQVLTYNLKRVMRILGIAGTMKAMRLVGA